jgi:two-component system LytT family sensor kinase
VRQKLIKTALLTSPILALYGLTPLFLFTTIQFHYHAVGFIMLSLMIFSFWRLNIYLVEQPMGETARFSISYAVTFLVHLGILSVIPDFSIVQSALTFLIYPLVSTLAINTIILVIINAEVLKNKKDRAESEIQKLKVGNLEAQKQILLQQLHPHFLFNALSTLKSLIRENQDDAESYSVKLSEFLRYSIQGHANEVVSVGDELQFARDYLELQKVRFGNALYWHLQIPDKVLQKKLPVFALQTLVENAVKHNTFTEKKPLHISIVQENNKLKVSNSRSQKPLVQRSGTGLANLTERYKLIAGQSIEVIQSENEFTVYIPLLDR